MDALNYVTSEANIQPCKSDVTLSKTSAANFAPGTKPVLASHRRLLCMNVKQTNVLRVLNRHGKHNDTTIKAASVAHLVSTEKMTSHPTLFYAVGGRDLAIICPTTQANGDISVSVVESTLDEDGFASTAGESQRLYILGQQNVMEVEESTGSVKSKIALAPKTAVKYPVIDYHQSAQLLLVPAKTTHLDLISTRTRKSALGRVWEPHEDATPTFACFFQHHDFSEETSEEMFIVTAAQGNREIRFWAYQSESQKFTLKQQLNFSHKDEPNEEYDISVTADEEYITLCSRTRPYAVVIETHHTLFKAYRTTSWLMAGPALCSTTSVGKVSETTQSKSVSYELFITIRTKDGFVQSMPSSSRLAGASNLFAPRPDSIMNWFPSMAAAGGGAAAGGAGDASAAAGGSTNVAMTPITAVSSSLSGESKTSGLSENIVSALLQTQARRLCEQVSVIDADLVGIQRNVSDTMRLLQDSRYRTEAQNSGRAFAVRNRARLEKSGSTVASPASQTPATASGAANNNSAGSSDAEFGVMSEGERDLILSITNFVRDMQDNSATAASASLKALLPKLLQTAVERAANEAGKLDVQGPIIKDLNSTESMLGFRRVVDESLRRIGTATKRYQEMNRVTVDASAAETERRLAEAEAFRQKLSNSLRSLKEEVGEVKTTLAQYQLSRAGAAGGGAAAAAIDPEAIIAAAVEKATAGEWKEAVTAVLATDDISILLTFLEHPVCKENAATLTSPKTLTLPLFLSLCLQLTFEMTAQTGSAPLRLQLFGDFYVEWDDYLRSIRAQAQKDAQQQMTYDIVRRELSTVLEALGTVPHEILDRKTRNKVRLVSKLITNLLTGE